MAGATTVLCLTIGTMAAYALVRLQLPYARAILLAMLALAIGALQLLLDRGQGNDWFTSTETWIELGVMALAAYLFVIHTLTAERPFFSRGLLADRREQQVCRE